jgi:DNA-directed RNA polymerase specialized sigma24 family protein
MVTNSTIPVPASVSQLTELIEDCRKGDQRAQLQIYKIYYKRMYNISLRVINNPAKAEDIMQESFLTAFEEISGYNGTLGFGDWLQKFLVKRLVAEISSVNY